MSMKNSHLRIIAKFTERSSFMCLLAFLKQVLEQSPGLALNPLRLRLPQLPGSQSAM